MKGWDWQATEKGNAEIVGVLLESGVPHCPLDADGETPLHLVNAIKLIHRVN